MEQNNQVYNEYIATLFAPQSPALKATLAEMQREHIPGMNVSPVEGKLLELLALLVGAKRILEIGTLGGYSGIHFARALPEDGKLVTLELDTHHANIARRNFERAGVDDKVEIHVGPATATLQQLAEIETPQFDLVFVDANKDEYPDYLERSLPLLREGGLMLGDNTLRILPGSEDNGIMRYNTAVANNPALTSIIIPILRHRGLDGLTVSLKRPPTH